MGLTEFVLEHERVSGIKEGPQEDEEVRRVLLDCSEEVSEGLVQQVVICGEWAASNYHLYTA